MPVYKSYHSYLIESLRNPSEAAAYIDAVLEDGDLEHILLALKNVAEAQKDLVKNADNEAVDFADCSPGLENQEPINLLTIAALLNQLGLKLSVTVKEKQPA